MKVSFLFFFMFIITIEFFPLSGQNQISIELEPFDQLSVSGRIDLELVRSDLAEMQITCRRIDPEKIKTVFEDGKLSIKIPPKIKNEDAVTIILPYHSLTTIHAAAGAVINSARDLTAHHLDLSASTGGKIELSVQTSHIRAKVSQVSDIILYGKSSVQEVMVKTGGNYLAVDMVCDSTYITVNGGGQGKITSLKYLDANAKAKGFIGYSGNPETMSLQTLLGGTISKYDEN
ncbi:head GIN domain-containing protein [Bacteroidota bacterium]